MIKIDFWTKPERLSKCTVSIFFYPNDGIYRGNLYLNGKAIADFYGNDSVEIEKRFTTCKRN